MPETAERKNIAGVAPCGCIRAAISGKEEASDYKKEIADWIGRGLEVRYLTNDELAAGQWNCQAFHPKQPLRQKAEQDILQGRLI